MTLDLFRIFILGAGFSQPAGYPLAPDLWREIRRRAGLLSGRAEQFQTDLDSYRQYRLDFGADPIEEDEIEFEDFCSYLDIEHFLGLRGSDTWSTDGNEGTVVIKTLLGQVLSEYTPSANDIPEIYLEFARRLKPNDRVLTFNYDVLLERALDAVDKPYRLFPTRYESVSDYGGVVDTTIDEVIVLKLHGSIDWFDRSEVSKLEALKSERGLTSRPVHPVFGTTGDDLRHRKVVDGPRHIDDPLAEMYRVDDVKKLYQRSWMFLAAPWLLAPSTMKILYATKLADFWNGLGRAGGSNLGLTIIGYSLPEQDDYAKQAVHSMVTNYQSGYWGPEEMKRKKMPVVIVDFKRTDDEVREFRDHFRFVDWDRAVGYFNGFDETSLGLIFDGTI